jgi:hypothetical protein
MDDSGIRALVGWRLRLGRLPSTEPVHLWAGEGHGEFCAGCGSIIDPTDVEYEMEWSDPLRTVRMHSRCYEIWRAERPPTSSYTVKVSREEIGSRPAWW